MCLNPNPSFSSIIHYYFILKIVIFGYVFGVLIYQSKTFNKYLPTWGICQFFFRFMFISFSKYIIEVTFTNRMLHSSGKIGAQYVGSS